MRLRFDGGVHDISIAEVLADPRTPTSGRLRLLDHGVYFMFSKTPRLVKVYNWSPCSDRDAV